MCTTLPKTHIAVMGMERIAPTFAEVDVLITMLARSAVGARLTGYNTWLTGRAKRGTLMVLKSFIWLLSITGVLRCWPLNFGMCCAVFAAGLV